MRFLCFQRLRREINPWVGAPAKCKSDLGIFLFDFDYYDNAENSNFKHLVWGGTSGSPPPLRMIIFHIQAASKAPKPFWRTRRIALGVHPWRQNHFGERAESLSGYTYGAKTIVANAQNRDRGTPVVPKPLLRMRRIAFGVHPWR